MVLMVGLLLLVVEFEVADGFLGFAVERTRDGIQEVFIKPRFYEGRCSREKERRRAAVDTSLGDAIDVQLNVIRTS